jgi:hypothetical protein
VSAEIALPADAVLFAYGIPIGCTPAAAAGLVLALTAGSGDGPWIAELYLDGALDNSLPLPQEFFQIAGGLFEVAVFDYPLDLESDAHFLAPPLPVTLFTCHSTSPITFSKAFSIENLTLSSFHSSILFARCLLFLIVDRRCLTKLLSFFQAKQQ